MTVSQEDDRKVFLLQLNFPIYDKDTCLFSLLQEGLKWFLDQKTAELSELENRCIAMTEGKERILAEISQSKVWFYA